MSAVIPIDQFPTTPPRAGRIRTGEQVKSRKTGKMMPTAFDHFRFTSADRSLIEWCAEFYGGKVESFDVPGSGDRWKVDAPTRVIDNAIVAGYTLSYELWQPHLERRCNGQTCEVLQSTPEGSDYVPTDCICARRGVLECNAQLRLPVILTGAPTIGAWRWDTKSENSIKEIRGFFDMLPGIGRYQCTMRLEDRTMPTEPGQPNRKFTVVALDYKGGIESLLAGESRLAQLPTPSPAGALGAGASSVTHTLDPSSAGEPMAGGVGDGAVPSTAASPTSPSTEHVSTCPFDHESCEDTSCTCDCHIVDAEVVDDDLDEWKVGLSGRQKSALLRHARDMQTPVPATFDAIADDVLAVLKAGEDEHTRATTDR